MAAITQTVAARTAPHEDSSISYSSNGACTEAAAAVNDSFPAGLRVLVVDDDPICLLILDRMLRQCQYQVTTCSRAADALARLRENRDGFDVIISDVYMPDMDGFKLLELVGLEMDLPVIMMSANGDTNVVMKGIKHGACDYLLKPVRLEELRNIWQHVVRKRWRSSSSQINCGEVGKTRQEGGADEGDHNSLTSEGLDGTWKQGKKRKDLKEEEEEVDVDNEDLSTSKKPRVVWSVDLHQQFVNAVNQLGIDKAVPKRILELMNVQGLTRENVASHLQKYRLYLKRISSGSHQPGAVVPSFPLASMDSNFNAAGLGSFNDLQAFAGGSSQQGLLPSSLQAAAGALGRLGSANGGGIANIDPAVMMQIAALHTKSPPFASYSNEKGSFQVVATTTEINQLQPSPQIGSFVGLRDGASPSLLGLQKQQLQSTANIARIGKLPGSSNHNPQVNQKDSSLIMQTVHQQHHESAGLFTSKSCSGVVQKGLSTADDDVWTNSISIVNATAGVGNGGITTQNHHSKPDSESALRRVCSTSNMLAPFRRATDAENTSLHISNASDNVAAALSTASALVASGLDNRQISSMKNVDLCPVFLNDGMGPLLSGLKQEESFQAKPISQGDWKTFNMSQGRNDPIQTLTFDNIYSTTRSFPGQEPEQLLHRHNLPINTTGINPGQVKCHDQDHRRSRSRTDKTKEENHGWLTEPLSDDLLSIVLKQEQGRLGITQRESRVMSYIGNMYSKTDH